MDDNAIRLFEDNIDISQVDTNMYNDVILMGILISGLTLLPALIIFLLITFIFHIKGKDLPDWIMTIIFSIGVISFIIIAFLSLKPVDKNYESQNWFSEHIAVVVPTKYHNETIELLYTERDEKSDNTVYDLIEDRFKEKFEEKKKELSQFDFDKACTREKSVHKNKEDINVLCGGDNFDSSLIVDGYIFNPEINIAQVDDNKDNAPKELSTNPKNTTVWADIVIDQPHTDDN